MIKPNGYWRNLQNQRAFLDNLASSWNITKPEDWYKVNANSVIQKGGWFIKHYYNASLLRGILRYP